jgi:hypothetical protein
VAATPAELLDPLRFSMKPNRTLPNEPHCDAVLETLANDCKIRRISVKCFFDDAVGRCRLTLSNTR